MRGSGVASGLYGRDISTKQPHLADGAWGEAVATAWLIEQGFHVFKNVAGKGPIDLVGVLDGQAHYFDVKTLQTEGMGMKGGGQLTARQVMMGVRLLYVTSLGICGFERSEVLAKLRIIQGGKP